MLSTVLLIAALIGQTTSEGPVLSEATKQAHAQAQAEFRANEPTIKPRLEAYYQLENQRLTERTATVDLATNRVLYFAAGARSAETFGVARSPSGFSSVPPIAPKTAWVYPDQPSLTELQRESYLIKGRLRDSQGLFREARQLYWAEYPIRYRLAGTPWGQR